MALCITFWFSEFFYFDTVWFLCLLFIVTLAFCLPTTNKNLLSTKLGYKSTDIVFCSPVPDIEWTDPQLAIIKNTPGKHEISDFGRELTILHVEPDDEGVYSCKGKGKTESSRRVFLNVTCKFFNHHFQQMTMSLNCLLRILQCRWFCFWI